jgi:hypothetical protein
MPHKALRTEFVIKDLAFSVGISQRGSGSTWLPADDGVLPPTPISPIAALIQNIDIIEAVRAAVVEAVEAEKYGEVGGAFAFGEAGGSPVIRAAIQEVGSAVVASAAFAALGAKGNPNPDDSNEPRPTLSPVVIVGRAVHRVIELPRLRAQLAETLAYVDRAVAAQAPRGNEEIAQVRTQLENALKSV